MPCMKDTRLKVCVGKMQIEKKFSSGVFVDYRQSPAPNPFLLQIVCAPTEHKG